MRITDWSSDVCSSDLLVTDDDPAHLAMVRNVLAPLGFDLVFADNGAACLAVCRAQLPDLVMLDITMPARDGWDTARALRAEPGDDPMIVMVYAHVPAFQHRHREDDPHHDFLTTPLESNPLHP